MPAVKERINEMARIMCGHQNNRCPMHHDAGCSHIGAVDCLYKQYAVALFRAGYVCISDDEEMIAKVKKQAQIDIINTIVKYCESPSHWDELKDCKLFGGKSDDLRDFLNGIFKEVDV